jgi:lipopolysaccharide heptosyltransferase II
MITENSTILIIKYSSLGDIINAIPAVRFLRSEAPGTKIYWLVKKPYASLISGNNFIDGVIVFDISFETIKEIRKLKPDIAIDLQGLLKSGFTSYLSGAPERICYPHTREGSSIFYTKIIGMKRHRIHAVMENLSVIETFLNKKCNTIDFSPEISEEALQKAKKLIGINNARPVILISPTSRWKTKMWEWKRFAELADKLNERLNASIIFIGAPNEAAYIETIKNSMKNNAVNLAGKTDVTTLAAVIKQADMLISCDSGSMHIASAVGTSVAAIFGPTDPVHTGPFSDKSIVLKADIPCAPCRKRTCKTMLCMNALHPEKIFEQINVFLKNYDPLKKKTDT